MEIRELNERKLSYFSFYFRITFYVHTLVLIVLQNGSIIRGDRVFFSSKETKLKTINPIWLAVEVPAPSWTSLLV